MDFKEVLSVRTAQSIDKHVMRLPPELTALKTNDFLQNTIKEAVKLELSPRLEGEQMGDPGKAADKFFNAFDGGMDYAMHAWRTHNIYDPDIAINNYMSGESEKDPVAFLSGYTAFRFAQGDTLFGIRALEKIADLKKIDRRLLLTTTYVDYLTNIMRGLTSLQSTNEALSGLITLGAVSDTEKNMREMYKMEWDASNQVFFEVTDNVRHNLTSTQLSPVS